MAGFLSNMATYGGVGALEQANSDIAQGQIQQKNDIAMYKTNFDKVQADQDEIDKEANAVYGTQKSLMSMYNIPADQAYTIATLPGAKNMKPDELGDLIQRMQPTGQSLPYTPDNPRNVLPGRQVNGGLFGQNYNLPAIPGPRQEYKNCSGDMIPGSPGRQIYKINPNFSGYLSKMKEPTTDEQAQDQWALTTFIKRFPGQNPPPSLVTGAMVDRRAIATDARENERLELDKTNDAIKLVQSKSADADTAAKLFNISPNDPRFNLLNAVNQKVKSDPVFLQKVNQGAQAIVSMHPNVPPDVARNIAMMDQTGMFKVMKNANGVTTDVVDLVTGEPVSKTVTDMIAQMHSQQQNQQNPSTPLSNSKYTPLVQAAANKYGIPQDIASRLVTKESTNNPNAVSNKGAIGLAQLKPGTAGDLGVNPNDPAQNVDGGMRYLRQQYDRFGSWPMALAAYNWGPKAFSDWMAAGGDMNKMPKETKDYVNTIMGNTQQSTTQPQIPPQQNQQNPSTPQSVPQGSPKQYEGFLQENPNKVLLTPENRNDAALTIQTTGNALSTINEIIDRVNKDPGSVGLVSKAVKEAGIGVGLANMINTKWGDWLDTQIQHGNRQRVESAMDALEVASRRVLAGEYTGGKAGMGMGANQELDGIFHHGDITATPQSVKASMAELKNMWLRRATSGIDLLYQPSPTLSNNRPEQFQRLNTFTNQFHIPLNDAISILQMEMNSQKGKGLQQ